MYVKSNTKNGESCDAYEIDPGRLKIYIMRRSTVMISHWI